MGTQDLTQADVLLSSRLDDLKIFKVIDLPCPLVANAIYLVASKEDASSVEVHIADKHGVSTRATLSKHTVQELINLASVQTLELAKEAAQEADQGILELGKEYTNHQVKQAHDNAVGNAKAYIDTAVFTAKSDATKESNTYTNSVAESVKKDAYGYADKTVLVAVATAKQYTDISATETLTLANQFTQQADDKVLSTAKLYSDSSNDELKAYVDESDAQILIEAKGEIHKAKNELNDIVEQHSVETLNRANSYTDDALTDAVQEVNQRTDDEIRKAIANAPNELLIVDSYVNLLKLIVTDDGRTKSKFVFVKDATGDDTVKKGSASYIYNAEVIKQISLPKMLTVIEKILKNPSQNIKASLKEFLIDQIFYKVAEHESMDVVLSWSDIQGKPISTIQEIDNTVESFSTLPLSILNGFKEVDNELYYKDQPIDRRSGMSYSGELNW